MPDIDDRLERGNKLATEVGQVVFGARHCPAAPSLGGACVAFYALSITFIGPRLGIANAILCVLLGQMICAAIIDQFGLLGAPVIEFTRTRALGLALMAAGLYFARSLPQAAGHG